VSEKNCSGGQQKGMRLWGGSLAACRSRGLRQVDSDSSSLVGLVRVNALYCNMWRVVPLGGRCQCSSG
jgi:hypothetical protein